jgi:hypothetical protein
MYTYYEGRYKLSVWTRKNCVCLIGIIWLTILDSVIAEETEMITAHSSSAMTNSSISNDVSTIQTDLLRIEEKLRQLADANPSDIKMTSISVSTPERPGHTVEGSMQMQKNDDKDIMDVGESMRVKNMNQPGMMKSNSTSSAMGEMRMMSMMGKRPDIADKKTQTSLPGVTGAAHLYHLGEQEFFLNYVNTIDLSIQQRELLIKIKQQWETRNRDMKNEIGVLEELLWQQTAVGKPDWQTVSKTIHDAERQRAVLRLAFIESVGSAVNILSKEQIGKLITFSNQSLP